MSDGVVRFSVTERALHWTFAIGYLALLASGLPLMLPALRGWIRGYTPAVGLRLHLAAAVLWLAGTFAVFVAGDRRRLAATWRDLTGFAREELAWLARFPRWLVARGGDRAWLDRTVGRFNAGQKLNVVFTVLTSVLLLVTGVLLTPVGGGAVVADLVTGAGTGPRWLTVHRWITLAVLVPLAGHVFLAAFHPATRHALHGMLSGRVDADWAAAHHPRWRRDDRETA